MKRVLFLLLMIFLYSCSSLPEIKPFDANVSPIDSKRCSAHFPEGEWQYIHSIEATLPNKQKAVVMGITNISSKKRAIKVVMMTIEGLVLFDAEYNGAMTIHKGVSPFDSTEFAKGLMDDIRLIFFKPSGTFSVSGYLNSGSRVCRYIDHEGSAEDIVLDKTNSYHIDRYNKYNKLIRSATIDVTNGQTGNNKIAIPEKIQLSAFVPKKYSLTMELIQAHQLSN